MDKSIKHERPKQVNPWKREDGDRRFGLYLGGRGHIMWFPDGRPGFGGTEISVDDLVMDTGLLHALGVPYPHATNFGGDVKAGRSLLARAIREKLNPDNLDFASAVESKKPMTVYYHMFEPKG